MHDIACYYIMHPFMLYLFFVKVLVENITRVTHSHSQGINGAILEASAVKIALQSADSVGSFSCSKMLTDLQKIMSTLETSNSEMLSTFSQTRKGRMMSYLHYLFNM